MCYLTVEKVTVKCNQTGKLFKARVSSLSRRDNGKMSTTDLAEGSQLLMNVNMKEDPVTLKKALKEVQIDGK